MLYFTSSLPSFLSFVSLKRYFSLDFFLEKKFLRKVSLSFSHRNSVKVTFEVLYIVELDWMERYRITASSNRLFFSRKIERENSEDGEAGGTKAKKYLKEGRKGLAKNRRTTVEWPRSKFFVMSKVQRLRLNRT